MLSTPFRYLEEWSTVVIEKREKKPFDLRFSSVGAMWKLQVMISDDVPVTCA